MSILKKAFVCGGVLLALAACEHGDPVSTAGGERGHGILLTGTPSASTLPSGGAALTLTFGGFDPAIRDWLGRKQADATRARRTRNFRSTALYWSWYNEFRDGTPSRIDPRTPAPIATNISEAYFELYQPSGAYPNAEYWEFYVELYDLKPLTVYEVAFVHRRLTVNGTLDHVQRVMDGTVTAPDQLAITSGTRAAINSDWSDNAPVGCAPYPGVTANPFVVATEASSANGTITSVGGTKNYLDKCWQSGNGIWTKAEFDQQAKSMVGRADDQTYALPNYNYIEVWEGVFGTGTLVGRVQIAQDLDPAGVAVKDAYPPFPAPDGAYAGAQMGPVPAVDASTSFPITDSLKSVIPGAGTLVLPPSRVVLTLRNIQRLEAPVYKAWFMNGVTGIAKVATGRYVRKVGTATVDSVASTSTFKGGPGVITFDVNYNTSPAVHGPYSDSLNFLVITKEDNAAATTPSISQPIWVKIFRFPPSSAGGAVTFGNFNRDSLPTAGDTSRRPVPFVPQGIATGGVLGDTATQLVAQSNGTTTRQVVFVGSRLEMKFTNLQRPPKGYQYLAYFRQKRDTTPVTPTVVNRDSTLVLAGGLTGAIGESIADADVAMRGGNLGPNAIAVARFDFDASGAPAGLCTYDRFRVYLVPKGGIVTQPTSLIFDMPLPDKLTAAVSCRP